MKPTIEQWKDARISDIDAMKLRLNRIREIILGVNSYQELTISVLDDIGSIAWEIYDKADEIRTEAELCQMEAEFKIIKDIGNGGNIDIP